MKNKIFKSVQFIATIGYLATITLCTKTAAEHPIFTEAPHEYVVRLPLGQKDLIIYKSKLNAAGSPCKGNSSDYCIFADIEDKGQRIMVGKVEMRESEKKEHKGETLYIEWIHVLENYQRQGIGRTLMDYIEKFSGYKTLELCAIDHQDFYHHLGFRPFKPNNNVDLRKHILES